MIDFKTGLSIMDIGEVIDIDRAPVINDACRHFYNANPNKSQNCTFVKHFL